MNEVWKPITGFNGLYEVSNLGNVRNTKTGRQLKAYTQPTGHSYIKSLGGRRGKFAFVHRLVYEAFIGEIPSGCVVRHKDGDATNNDVENLCIGTQKDNIHDIYAYGRKCGSGKLFAEDVAEIRKRLLTGARSCDLAREFNVSQQTIYNIKSNKTFYYI